MPANLLYKTARSALFLLPTELSHHCTLASIQRAEQLGLLKLMPAPVQRPVRCMQLTFRNALGLAAGLDKDAIAVEGLLALGFGFVEVGTVTPRPQEGNPLPRLFRLPRHEALINRMGFNNQGMHAMRSRLEAVRSRDKLAGGLIGVNIGKNKDTPNERAEDDYLACMDELYALADYMTVNLSSPNTPGLRELQSKERMQVLLSVLRERQLKLAQSAGKYTPLLVKIAPDLSAAALGEIAEVVKAVGIDGVIATNTSISRPLPESSLSLESGGLSGKPIFAMSLACVQQMRQELGADKALFGVGGISAAEDALQMRAAGASLVQVYSAFIYQGPGLLRNIARALS